MKFTSFIYVQYRQYLSLTLLNTISRRLIYLHFVIPGSVLFKFDLHIEIKLLSLRTFSPARLHNPALLPFLHSTYEAGSLARGYCVNHFDYSNYALVKLIRTKEANKIHCLPSTFPIAKIVMVFTAGTAHAAR